MSIFQPNTFYTTLGAVRINWYCVKCCSQSNKTIYWFESTIIIIFILIKYNWIFFIKCKFSVLTFDYQLLLRISTTPVNYVEFTVLKTLEHQYRHCIASFLYTTCLCRLSITIHAKKTGLRTVLQQYQSYLTCYGAAP